MDPTELGDFLPAQCHKMGVPYFIIWQKARLGGVWSTGRPAPLSPSHRLPKKAKELLLSWWKPSRLITMTDMLRSTVTGEVMAWVQSQWLSLPSWKS